MTGRHIDPLVDVAWLAARRDAPDLRVLDCTWRMPGDARGAYDPLESDRIPGAIRFDLEDISDESNALPHMLPPPAKFASRMRAAGVGDGATVVCYDADGLFSAARVWWTFRVMGHEDVFVLDGGLPAWTAEGQPVESGPRAPRPPRHYTARQRSDLVKTLPQMRRVVETGAAQVLDARSAGRFAGVDPEPRPGLRGGHMPGAVSLPFGRVLEAGRMKSKAALTEVFAQAGADLRRPLVTSCGSGVTAPILALALARLGRWDVSVYDGSWTEWAAQADTPVVSGG